MSTINNTTVNFEQSLKELESLVVKLESGELSLEDSLKYFEQGINLTSQCQQAIAQAEQKVQILTEQNQQCDLRPYDDSDTVE